MTLKTTIEKIVSAIGTKAAEKDASLPEITDALKALTQYYAVLQKGKKLDPDDSDEDTFDQFQASLTGEQPRLTEEPKNGRNSSVRARSRAS